MKKWINTLVVFVFAIGMTQMVVAAEHGGKEHGGSAKEIMKDKVEAAEVVEAVEVVEPSKDDIRNTMSSYVEDQADKMGGTFQVKDPDSGNVLNLTMEKVHERVGKTGDYYYSCADFKDETGKMWDLDIDVEDKNGELKVADVRVHKEDNVPSYSYDDEDNRYPLVEGTKRHLGSKAALMGEGEGDPKVSEKENMEKSLHEHGGHEHGGAEHEEN